MAARVSQSEPGRCIRFFIRLRPMDHFSAVIAEGAGMAWQFWQRRTSSRRP